MTVRNVVLASPEPHGSVPTTLRCCTHLMFLLPVLGAACSSVQPLVTPTPIPIEFMVSALDVSTAIDGETSIEFLVMNTGGTDLSCSLAWLYLFDSVGDEVGSTQAKSPLDGFFDFITLPRGQWTPLDARIEGQPTWASYRVHLMNCEEYPDAKRSRLFLVLDTRLDLNDYSRGQLATVTAKIVNVSGRPDAEVSFYAILYDQEGRLVSMNLCSFATDVALMEPVPFDCLVVTEPGVEPRIEWIVQGRWHLPEG